MHRARRLIVLAGILACLLPGTVLALTKPERKEARAMLSGTLYLRTDAPWYTEGSAVPLPFSPMIKEALVEVTPTEVRPEKDKPGTMILWELGVNDAVQLEDFEVEGDGTVHIDLEPADGQDKQGAMRGEDKHGILHFVGINTLADFKAAFDQSFSRVPLEDEHSDWPADIRRAIASRQLMDGMTKRQAYCVTGPPASFEQTTKDGKQVEVWRLKTNRIPRYTFLLSASNGPMLRFEDGKLVGVGNRNDGTKVNLDQ
jgi:hypothetical protein